jgi:metal-responsive CopG/Arc/MetJ family transcriptional regulator
MASHMKTTVQIPDALLAEVQRIAAKNKTTLRALVQEGLQHVVDNEQKKKKPFKLGDMSYPPKYLVKEKTEPKSWDEIRAIIYEGFGE